MSKLQASASRLKNGVDEFLSQRIRKTRQRLRWRAQPLRGEWRFAAFLAMELEQNKFFDRG
jgi:hypothetical protein